MLGSLSTGVSGLSRFQDQIDVIGNNIANVSTTGYKTARMDFMDAFHRTLQSFGGTGTTQVGTGVVNAGVRSQYVQGSIVSTGVATHLAVSGDGFFVARDIAGTTLYATRDGGFHLNQQGYLVTTNGMAVQGFSDGLLTTRGDVRIDATGAPVGVPVDATVVAFNIDTTGQVKVRLSDGTEFIRGQVLLQNFADPQALKKEGNNLLSDFAAAGPLTQTETPGTKGLGDIQANALEMSNVDLASEMASLITAQRAFQANARMITTSDEVLQELVSLKR